MDNGPGVCCPPPPYSPGNLSKPSVRTHYVPGPMLSRLRSTGSYNACALPSGNFMPFCSNPQLGPISPCVKARVPTRHTWPKRATLLLPLGRWTWESTQCKVDMAVPPPAQGSHGVGALELFGDPQRHVKKKQQKRHDSEIQKQKGKVKIETCYIKQLANKYNDNFSNYEIECL